MREGFGMDEKAVHQLIQNMKKSKLLFEVYQDILDGRAKNVIDYENKEQAILHLKKKIKYLVLENETLLNRK